MISSLPLRACVRKTRKGLLSLHAMCGWSPQLPLPHKLPKAPDFSASSAAHSALLRVTLAGRTEWSLSTLPFGSLSWLPVVSRSPNSPDEQSRALNVTFCALGLRRN